MRKFSDVVAFFFQWGIAGASPTLLHMSCMNQLHLKEVVRNPAKVSHKNGEELLGFNDRIACTNVEPFEMWVDRNAV